MQYFILTKNVLTAKIMKKNRFSIKKNYLRYQEYNELQSKP